MIFKNRYNTTKGVDSTDFFPWRGGIPNNPLGAKYFSCIESSSSGSIDVFAIIDFCAKLWLLQIWLLDKLEDSTTGGRGRVQLLLRLSWPRL